MSEFLGEEIFFLQNLCQKYDLTHSYLESILDLHRVHASNFEAVDDSEVSETDLIEMEGHDPDDLRPYREHLHPRIDLDHEKSIDTFNDSKCSTAISSKVVLLPASKKR